MAIFKVTAKPDFTELKSAISGLESTPIKIDIDTTPVIAKIKATSQNLTKMTQTLDGSGQLTGVVSQYNSKLGETVQITQRLNKETGNLEVTQEKVTQNYEKVAKAAERAAQIQAKAQEAAAKAQEAEANRAAAEAQKIQNVLGSMGTNIGTFSGNAAEAKEWIASLDGMSGATVKATGNVRNAAGVFQTYSAAVDGAKGTTDNFTFAINESTGEVYKLANGAVDAAKNNSLLGDSIGRVLLKMAAWQVFGDLISKVIGSFRDALNTLKDVDTEMVNVQKVTDYSSTQMQALEENAYALASAYGRTADEITAMYTTFARAGYLDDQLDSMTELGTLLANIGDISQDTASKFLLAVDAAWKLNGSESELMTVMDGLNEITNKNAVDMEALTSGITVAGSVFAEAGESVQTFSALVGAGVAATQRSGSEISRGLRTIVMNIRQIKGETEDGELVDGESIAKASNALREYAGISTMANGQLRESSAVLSDLAGKWDTLDTVAQSAIAEALAGKRQANILTALMGSWGTVEKMMQDYADGAGSALRENEIYLDSWEAKSKQLTASWTEFVSHLVETDTIKDALDDLIGLVELLDTDFGRAVVTAGGAAAALWGVVAAINAIKKASAALNLASLNPWVLGIMAVGAAIGIVLEVVKAAQKSIADFDAEIADANDKLQSNKTRLEEISNMPWNERTADIIKERQALEDENAELEKQIELLKEERIERAQKDTGSGFSIQTDKRTAQLEHGAEIEYGNTYSGNEAYSWATDTLKDYINALKEKGQLTEEQMAQYELINPQIAEQVELLQLLEQSGTSLTSEQQALIAAYNDMSRAMEIAVDNGQTLIESYTALAEAGYITEEQYKKLISLYPELESQAVQTAKGYVIQKNALTALMNAEQQQQAKSTVLVNDLIAEAQQAGYTGKALYDLVAAQITASKTNLNFSQQIAALQALGYQAGLTAAQMNAVFGTNMSSADQVRNRERTIQSYMQQGMSRKQAETKYLSEMQRYLSWSIGNTTSKVTSGGGGYGGGSSSSSAAKKKYQDEIDALEKARDAELAAIDAQIEALKKQNEETERGEKLEELKLAVLKKQDALLNARNERTVRMYNAESGQWEWIADPEKVKKAEEDLADAKKDLRDYEREMELDLAIEELEARKKAIEAAYQLKIDALEEYINALSETIEQEKILLEDEVAANEAAAKRIAAARAAAAAGAVGGAAAGALGGGSEKSPAADSALSGVIAGAIGGSVGKSSGVPAGATAKDILAGGGKQTGIPSGTTAKDILSGAGSKSSGKSNRTSVVSGSIIGAVSGGRGKKYDSGGVLHGLGGIKATVDDEMVLPPDVTAKMLKPSADARFRARVNELGGLYGETPVSRSVAGSSDNRSYSDHSGPTYNVKGITLTEQQAEHLTVAQMCRMAHNVKPYGG
nr:MAG TPA: minor tail protein [Caudoviricetes sp.]